LTRAVEKVEAVNAMEAKMEGEPVTIMTRFATMMILFQCINIWAEEQCAR
jgi:hypothetical protein